MPGLLDALLERLAGRLAPRVLDRLSAVLLRDLERHIADTVVPSVTESVTAALSDRTVIVSTTPLQAEKADESERALLLSMAPSSDARVHFLQTADAVRYRPLLDLTFQTVREYCGRHGFSCEAFIGVVRGFYSWQASYNRIPLLRRIANSGFSGWLCYMDADAYIIDLDFDLIAYLEDKRDVALILAPGGPNADWWNVNDGVFLINLGHRKARLVVEVWNNLFGEITDEELRSRPEWYPENHDQTLLWYALQGVPDLQDHVLIDTTERIINYHNGRFIRQVLRAYGDMDARLALVQSELARVLGQASPLRHAGFS